MRKRVTVIIRHFLIVYSTLQPLSRQKKRLGASSSLESIPCWRLQSRTKVFVLFAFSTLYALSNPLDAFNLKVEKEAKNNTKAEQSHELSKCLNILTIGGSVVSRELSLMFLCHFDVHKLNSSLPFLDNRVTRICSKSSRCPQMYKERDRRRWLELLLRCLAYRVGETSK